MKKNARNDAAETLDNDTPVRHEDTTLTREESDEQIMNRQFVTFVIADEVFAFPMACVREIIRMAELVRLPLAPPSLEGLANLRGKVLPIINLRHVFKFQKQDHSESTRVIVVDTGVAVGFVVDRVSSVITVENEQIEPVDALESTIDSRLLTGMLKNVGKQEMVMLLDAARLMEGEFASLASQTGPQGDQSHTSAAGETESAAQQASSEIQLVSFSVAEQEYAFPMESVQEIVQVPNALCHVPKARSYVLGVMTLRNRLLPVVSLRQMFSLPTAPLEEHNRIVVISLKTAMGLVSVGIVMDKVKEVLRLPKSQVDALPSILAQDREVQEIESICRLDEGKRLVSVISVEKLFEHQALSEAMQVQAEGAEEDVMRSMETEIHTDDEDQMVIFKLGNEEYAVRVECVQEILRVPDQFTHVPKTVTFIEGLISLRGTVLPVIDLRRRFGLATKERDERQRIMVFTIRSVRTGMIVDAVSEVLKIAKASLEPAPSLSEEQGRVIRLVANLEKQKRMFLVLEIDELLSHSEVAALETGVTGDKAAHSR